MDEATEESGKVKRNYNVFVGAESGILKGVSINSKNNYSRNLRELGTERDKSEEITALSWSRENEVLYGTRGQTLKIFDVTDETLSKCIRVEDESATPLRGVGRLQDESLVTASQGGIVKIWKFKDQEEIEYNCIEDEILLNARNGRRKNNKLLNKPSTEDAVKKEHLAKLRASRHVSIMKLNGTLVATGGKEHNLQVRDLGAVSLGKDIPVLFRAKNVKNDFLELRVPIWITDLAFLEGQSILACASRYGHIRLYDVRSGQRRPVVDMTYPEEEPLTCMSHGDNGRRIIVGTSKGGLALYDFRQESRGMVRKYKGNAGSIRCIDYENGHFASVGLDRFLRVYQVESPKIQHKIYLKSRLNCVVLKKGFDPDNCPVEEKKKVPEECGSDIEIIEDDEAEILWSNMESIEEEKCRKSRKRKIH